MTAPHVPVLGVCAACKRPVKPGTRDAIRQVTGWEHFSRTGRADKVTNRKPTGKVMCGTCAQHPSIPQESLL